MDQINYFHKFRILKRGSKATDNHTFVTVHMFFDLNFDIRRNSRMVSGGYITGYRVKGDYCSVINIDTVRTDFFQLVLPICMASSLYERACLR